MIPPREHGGLFKPVIRTSKNIRVHLPEHGAIPKSLVSSSSFLESLLYNVPNYYFRPEYQSTVSSILEWLQSTEGYSRFVRQDEQQPLFGNTLDQWSEDKAREFVEAAVEMWDRWPPYAAPDDAGRGDIVQDSYTP